MPRRRLFKNEIRALLRFEPSQTNDKQDAVTLLVVEVVVCSSESLLLSLSLRVLKNDGSITSHPISILQLFSPRTLQLQSHTYVSQLNEPNPRYAHEDPPKRDITPVSSRLDGRWHGYALRGSIQAVRSARRVDPCQSIFESCRPGTAVGPGCLDSTCLYCLLPA